MRILIDADILRYQIGSVKAAHPFIPKEYVPAPEGEICKLVEDLIQHVFKINKGDEYICALSGKGNFRNEVAKQEPYKGNRDPNEQRPFHYATVGDYIIKNHPHVVVDGMEADDWLAIEQRKDPENTLIATRDKDLWTCYGWHYRWACGENQPEIQKHWVDEFESKRFFFEQLLHGDNTDNIMGCGKKQETMWGGKLMMRRKGVGEKTAIKILENLTTVQEMYDAVKLEYEKVFGEEHESAMLENARLLYIGQTPDNLFEWGWLDYSLSKDTDNEPEATPTDLCEPLDSAVPEPSADYEDGTPF